jgi:hypothetical protein
VLTVPEQLDALQTQLARQRWKVTSLKRYALKQGIASYVFVLESNARNGYELRIYEAKAGQLTLVFRFSPTVRGTTRYIGRSPEQVRPKVVTARDLDQDFDEDLVVDLPAGAEDVAQVLPLRVTWDQARRDYVVQPLVRTPVRLPRTKVDANSRQIESDARRYAHAAYVVKDQLRGVSFRAYGFGSYTFLPDRQLLSDYRVDSGAFAGGSATDFRTVIQIQLWIIGTSTTGETAVGRCTSVGGQDHPVLIGYPRIATDDDYAAYLRAYHRKYKEFFSQSECLDPFQ